MNIPFIPYCLSVSLPHTKNPESIHLFIVTMYSLINDRDACLLLYTHNHSSVHAYTIDQWNASSELNRKALNTGQIETSLLDYPRIYSALLARISAGWAKIPGLLNF
jgi:hypothetical protein